jgi:putative phosphoesterase
MILGFVSDAHGNALGLDRCLEALQRIKAERIYFLGDCVGYMPHEEAVLSRLKATGVTCIRGNHEEMLLGKLPFSATQDAVYRLTDVRSRLARGWINWIESWPTQLTLVVDGVRLLLVHGSPLDPISGYVYPDTDLTAFHSLPHDVVLLGHTHRPFIRASGPVTVVNVGSCGLPRDSGGAASCASYDTATGRADILRVEFDAGGLVATLGEAIHASVAECLRRRPAVPIVGRFVDG